MTSTDPFERDRGRFARYQELRDFYAGVQWAGKPRRGETRMVANYARALVRKVVSYALPDPVGFSVPAPVLTEADGGGREAEEIPPAPRLPPPASDLTRARQEAGEAQANSVETLLTELLAE